jgi:hypothetical protein
MRGILPFIPTPLTSSPERGHDASVVSAGLSLFSFADDDHPYYLFRWRPALHNVYENPLGYAPGLEIRFLDTEIHASPTLSRIKLNTLNLLEVLSLPHSYPHASKMSWHLKAAYLDPLGCDPDRWVCQKTFVQLGLGHAFYLLDEGFIVYGLGQGELGNAAAFDFPLYGGPNFTMGAIWHIHHKTSLYAKSSITYYFSNSRILQMDTVSFKTNSNAYLGQFLLSFYY